MGEYGIRINYLLAFRMLEQKEYFIIFSALLHHLNKYSFCDESENENESIRQKNVPTKQELVTIFDAATDLLNILLAQRIYYTIITITIAITATTTSRFSM